MPVRYYADSCYPVLYGTRRNFAIQTFREIHPHLSQDEMYHCFERRYCHLVGPLSDQPLPNSSTTQCLVPRWSKVGWTKDHILHGTSWSETGLSFTPIWSLYQTMSSRAVYMPWLMCDYQCSPLHMALVAGDGALVDGVLRMMSGPLVDYRDSLGNTVLMMACASRSTQQVIKKLFRRTSSPDEARQLVRATNSEGLTAMHFAVINARPELVRLLLKKGADPNAGTIMFDGTRCGMTPLLVCVSLIFGDTTEKMMACAGVLLGYGADPNIPGLECIDQWSEEHMIYYECECGGCWSRQIGLSPLLVPPKCLTDQMRPVVRTCGGMLHVAVRKRLDVHIIKKLMDSSKVPIDLESYNGAGLTMMGVAVTDRNKSAAKFLVQRGASATAQNIYSDGAARLSPLHKMAGTEVPSFVQPCCFCFQLYCNEERLWKAMQLKEAMEELLEMLTPKDLETQDSLGRTPLNVAAQYYSTTACEMLLDAGANPLAVDGRQRSCIYYVCYMRDEHPDKERMLQIFLKHGAGRDVPQSRYNDVNSPLSLVFHNKDRATLRRLFLAGAVTATHLRAMMDNLQRLPPPVNRRQARREKDFMEAMMMLLARCPRSLQDLALYKVAALLPPARPEETSKNMDDVDVPHMKDRMRQLGLM